MRRIVRRRVQTAGRGMQSPTGPIPHSDSCFHMVTIADTNTDVGSTDTDADMDFDADADADIDTDPDIAVPLRCLRKIAVEGQTIPTI